MKQKPLSCQFVEKRIQVGERSVFYREGGQTSNKTPILFLHGWGISTQPYQEILELLAQQHHVIAPDLPGFAQSSSPQLNNNYGSYAELLIGFIQALHLEKVHLIGHSFGGGLSVTIAALKPERVESIVLLDSTGVPVGSVPETLLKRAIEMPLQISPAKLKLQFFDIPQVFSYNLLFRLENVIQALLLSLQKDLRPLFGQIQAPCLLLWSTQDLTTPPGAAQEFAQKIANSQLVMVEEGCHEWSLWYPEKFAAIALEFITGVERSRFF
jgi:pimeloyl-ACP methyl ester carboxylesterase